MIRAVSFNIRNGDADDGPNSWSHRASILSRILLGLEADILCLQEVMSYQLDEILEALPGYGFVGVGRIDGVRKGEFAPILYRQSVLEVLSSDSFWLSESPFAAGSKSWGTACERICTLGTFRYRDGRLVVANTHLDHVSQVAREKGTKLILGYLSPFEDMPRILAGDLNAEPENSIHPIITGSGFSDSLAGSTESTFHDFGRAGEGRIDYLYYSGLKLLKSWIEPGVIDDRFASDHHAVVAEFAA